MDDVNPFLFIKNKMLIIPSEGFSALEKNAVVYSQRAMLPIQLGVTALFRYNGRLTQFFVKI
jgi:hypothetical protein